MMEAKTEMAGWWRPGQDKEKVAAIPGRDDPAGTYICTEAVEAVRVWIDSLEEWFSEQYDVRPTWDAVEHLLAGKRDRLQNWEHDQALHEMTDEMRTKLESLYAGAWGRPPSGGELEVLLRVATESPLYCWLS